MIIAETQYVCTYISPLISHIYNTHMHSRAHTHNNAHTLTHVHTRMHTCTKLWFSDLLQRRLCLQKVPKLVLIYICLHKMPDKTKYPFKQRHDFLVQFYQCFR